MQNGSSLPPTLCTRQANIDLLPILVRVLEFLSLIQNLAPDLIRPPDLTAEQAVVAVTETLTTASAYISRLIVN
jgi:hypothetical protein